MATKSVDLGRVVLNAVEEYRTGLFGVPSVKNMSFSGEKGRMRADRLEMLLQNTTLGLDDVVMVIYEEITITTSTVLKECVYSHILTCGIWYDEMMTEYKGCNHLNLEALIKNKAAHIRAERLKRFRQI